MRRTSVLMATIMMIGVLIAASALAGESSAVPAPPMPCQGRMRHAPEGPLPIAIVMLVRCQEIDVLSELTGLATENVRQLLISSPSPAILESYGVPFDAFRSAMDKQSLKLVRQAQLAGMITKKQEDEIQRRVATKPDRPAPMGKAVH